MHKENDAVVNEVVASAHIENYAMKLFLYADKSDRAGNFTKSVVKSFYSAGILFDVMQCFGEVTPEVGCYQLCINIQYLAHNRLHTTGSMQK